MRFSVQLLAVAATVMSFNATPRDTYAIPETVLPPAVQAAAFDVMPAAQAAHENEPAAPASPLAWVLAAGFLGLVIMRRVRG